MSQPNSSEDASWIARDLLCIQCGYNLRTRTPADLCPGCGLRVAISTDFERAQPPLADGCGALAMGAIVMVGLGALNFVVHLLSNLTAQVFGRPVWVRIFDPTLAVVRLVDVVLLIFAVLCFARSRLSPPVLRRGMPLTGFLVIGLAGVAVTTVVLAGINVAEFQAHGRVGFTLFRVRHLFFLLQTITHLPLFICGWLYFRNLTRRAEFAGFRAWVPVFFWVDFLFWVLFGVLEVYYLVVLFVTMVAPPEEVYNVTRMVDWVQLASVLPEMIFWWLLARKAWSLRKERAALA